MSFSDVLTKVLPFIGAAATGGVPALIGMAATAVSEVLGIPVEPTAQGVSAAFAGASPEQVVALRTRELEFQERMQAMGFADAKDLRDTALKETQVFVADTSDARHVNAGDKKTFWLGVGILGIHGIVMILCLYGCYQLLTGSVLIKDQSLVVAIAGFLGSIVGYVAANAQQVVAYFFGSSKGSQDKTNAMATAFKDIAAK